MRPRMRPWPLRSATGPWMRSTRRRSIERRTFLELSQLTDDRRNQPLPKLYSRERTRRLTLGEFRCSLWLRVQLWIIQQQRREAEAYRRVVSLGLRPLLLELANRNTH